MLPLRLFRNRTFSGANGTTLAVYAALGAALFLVVLELQLALGLLRAWRPARRWCPSRS